MENAGSIRDVVSEMDADNFVDRKNVTAKHCRG